MFDVRYKGLRLIPSKTAGRELIKYGFMIEDCKEILEKGYSPRKRGKETIHRNEIAKIKDFWELRKP